MTLEILKRHFKSNSLSSTVSLSAKDECNALELKSFLAVCLRSLFRTGYQRPESVSAIFDNLFVRGSVLWAYQC